MTERYPSVSYTGLPRQYRVTAEGGSDYLARLTLCYDDLELDIASIPRTQEPSLHAYHYQGGVAWQEHSTVDTVNNTVTADGITQFGVWGLGVSGNAPTAVMLQGLRAGSSGALPVALGAIVFVSAVGLVIVGWLCVRRKGFSGE